MNENNTQPTTAESEDDKKLSKTIDQLLSEFKESKKNMEYIRPEMLPGIDLYMDQVTTFMEQYLGGTKKISPGQDFNENHDQQLREKRSFAASGKEEIFQRSSSFSDNDLLPEKYVVHERYKNTDGTCPPDFEAK